MLISEYGQPMALETHTHTRTSLNIRHCYVVISTFNSTLNSWVLSVLTVLFRSKKVLEYIRFLRLHHSAVACYLLEPRRASGEL